ncbi:MAG: hypothetical protein GKR89_12650 [Candidatus Latescibacteria bacterium]|nr:hypothetical protein [Candidatus Latescibacterota bacterium]
MKWVILVLAGALAVGCRPGAEPGPFAQAEEQTWRQVNRNHRGEDGIYVQATWRTFAYEIALAYEQAEDEGLVQNQLESRLRQLIYGFINGNYPAEDGTDINNFYIQYLVYVNPSFDPTNRLEKSVFDTWRGQFVRKTLDKIYDPKYPVLRNYYDERWGLTLYSRLVFTVYLNSEDSDLRPPIADIGGRTFLVDQEGNRYAASRTQPGRPYLYDFDRPERDYLDGKDVYRVFFPNRKADRQTPIVTKDSKFVALEIDGLGDEPVRRLQWDLPFEYPEMPARRLPETRPDPSAEEQ